MIGAQVVDLLSEHDRPKILADKLHQVQLVLRIDKKKNRVNLTNLNLTRAKENAHLELWRLFGELLDDPVPGVEPDELQVCERLLPLFGVSLLEHLTDQLEVKQLERDLVRHGERGAVLLVRVVVAGGHSCHLKVLLLRQVLLDLGEQFPLYLVGDGGPAPGRNLGHDVLQMHSLKTALSHDSLRFKFDLEKRKLGKFN
jgi:hypothetical protein